MNNIYYFDANGACISIVVISDPAIAEELGKRNGAASFIVSDLNIPLQRARSVNGKLVDVEPQVSQEVAWSQVREKRGFLLLESDWTVLPDAPVDAAKRAEWVSYRQALRDITSQTDPLNIAWPIKPQ